MKEELVLENGMETMTSYLVGMSAGEVVDRRVIWELKRIHAPVAKHAILDMQLKPLRALTEALFAIAGGRGAAVQFNASENALWRANSYLWHVEDELRMLEEKAQFDEHFIMMARQVYLTNDERSAAKKKINEIFDEQEEVKVFRRDATRPAG